MSLLCRLGATTSGFRRDLATTAAPLLGTPAVAVMAHGRSHLAATTPTPTPSGQLGHTVTTFAVLFLGLAVLAVVMFVVVAIRLRRTNS